MGPRKVFHELNTDAEKKSRTEYSLLLGFHLSAIPYALMRTSEMSLMRCDRHRNFLLTWFQRVSGCCLQLRCGLPTVTEGMLTSEASAADVRQAPTCGLAIRLISLSFSVLCHMMNNAYPAQASPMDTLLFGNRLDGVFFNLSHAATAIPFVPIVEMLMVP